MFVINVYRLELYIQIVFVLMVNITIFNKKQLEKLYK